MPFPATHWVQCKCERCGFDGQRAADIPHVCLVMVNLDQFEQAQKNAARYLWWRSKWSAGSDAAMDELNDVVSMAETNDEIDAAIDAALSGDEGSAK